MRPPGILWKEINEICSQRPKILPPLISQRDIHTLDIKVTGLKQQENHIRQEREREREKYIFPINSQLSMQDTWGSRVCQLGKSTCNIRHTTPRHNQQWRLTQIIVWNICLDKHKDIAWVLWICPWHSFLCSFQQSTWHSWVEFPLRTNIQSVA